MSNPAYRNGTAAQVGDIITVCTGGPKSSYLVVALTPIIDTVGNTVHGAPPAHPERCAVVIPYDEHARRNLDVSRHAVLAEDFAANPQIFQQGDNPVEPIPSGR